MIWQPATSITAGGVYDGGNFSAAHTAWDAGTIVVETTQPVILRNMRIRNLAGGTLLWTWGDTDVTVENCVFYGGRSVYTSGRAVLCYEQKNIIVRNCTFQYTRGVEVTYGDPTGIVLVTKCRHIDPAGGDIGLGLQVGNFVQTRVAYGDQIEISWNEIISHPQPDHQGPYSIMAEDTISIYHTAGVDILDNMIWHQSYPGNLDGSGQPNLQFSSQGGITLDESDGAANPVSNCNVLRNQLVDGYGIVCYTNYNGSNNILQGNRIVNDGYLDDGRKTENSWSTPLVIISGAGSGNRALDNYVSYRDRDGVQPSEPWDQTYNSHAAYGLRGSADGANAAAALNTYVDNPTAAMEKAEWDHWKKKLRANGITVGARLGPALGPVWGGPTTRR